MNMHDHVEYIFLTKTDILLTKQFLNMKSTY